MTSVNHDGQEAVVPAVPLPEIDCPSCNTLLEVTDAAPLEQLDCPVCGEPITVPAKLGEYLLLEQIGSGGMGAVFWGIDVGLDRDVAIKFLLREIADDPEKLAGFQAEAKAAARVNHSNVGHVYAFGEAQGWPYIVMEYLDGRSLKSVIDEEGRVSQLTAVEATFYAAQGLAAAAAEGLVHGDVKPENIILVDSKSRAKIIDFGLSSLVGKEAGNVIWGSPYYVAPEVIQRKKTDFRVDIYGLGATLYHALAGRPPFLGEDAMDVLRGHLHEEPVPVCRRHKGILPEVDMVVNRMLAKSAAARYPTYESLIGDLRRAMKKISAGARASSKVARVHKGMPSSGSGSKRIGEFTRKMMVEKRDLTKGTSGAGVKISRSQLRQARGPVTSPGFSSRHAAPTQQTPRKKETPTALIAAVTIPLVILGVLGLIYSGTSSQRSRRQAPVQTFQQAAAPAAASSPVRSPGGAASKRSSAPARTTRSSGAERVTLEARAGVSQALRGWDRKLGTGWRGAHILPDSVKSAAHGDAKVEFGVPVYTSKTGYQGSDEFSFVAQSRRGETTTVVVSVTVR